MDIKFFVEELQTYDDGSTAQISFPDLGEDDAQERYHLWLAAAAKSGLPCHAVTILDQEGRMVERKCYKKHKEEQATAD